MESAQVRGSDTERHFWKYFVLIIRASIHFSYCLNVKLLAS